MLKKTLYITLFCLLGLSFQSNAQNAEKNDSKNGLDTLEIIQHFDGANIIIKNPQEGKKKNGFAIKEILMNESEVIPFENKPEIEINLIDRVMQDGDVVKLQIIYSGKEKPTLVRPTITN